MQRQAWAEWLGLRESMLPLLLQAAKLEAIKAQSKQTPALNHCKSIGRLPVRMIAKYRANVYPMNMGFA
jgi:hypothetical protein